VIFLGEIIEEYPNDYPLPSCLMFYNDIKPLHVVLSYNETNQKTYLYYYCLSTQFNAF